MSKYLNMNEVPIQTKVKIKENGLVGHVVEVFHFPTTFKVEFEDGSFGIYKTHAVELLDNPGEKKDE